MSTINGRRLSIAHSIEGKEFDLHSEDGDGEDGTLSDHDSDNDEPAHLAKMPLTAQKTRHHCPKGGCRRLHTKVRNIRRCVQQGHVRYCKLHGKYDAVPIFKEVCPAGEEELAAMERESKHKSAAESLDRLNAELKRYENNGETAKAYYVTAAIKGEAAQFMRNPIVYIARLRGEKLGRQSKAAKDMAKSLGWHDGKWAANAWPLLRNDTPPHTYECLFLF